MPRASIEYVQYGEWSNDSENYSCNIRFNKISSIDNENDTKDLSKALERQGPLKIQITKGGKMQIRVLSQNNKSFEYANFKDTQKNILATKTFSLIVDYKKSSFLGVVSIPIQNIYYAGYSFPQVNNTVNNANDEPRQTKPNATTLNDTDEDKDYVTLDPIPQNRKIVINNQKYDVNSLHQWVYSKQQQGQEPTDMITRKPLSSSDINKIVNKFIDVNNRKIYGTPYECQKSCEKPCAKKTEYTREEGNYGYQKEEHSYYCPIIQNNGGAVKPQKAKKPSSKPKQSKKPKQPTKSTYTRTTRKHTDKSGKTRTIYTKGGKEYVQRRSKKTGKVRYELVK